MSNPLRSGGSTHPFCFSIRAGLLGPSDVAILPLFPCHLYSAPYNLQYGWAAWRAMPVLRSCMVFLSTRLIATRDYDCTRPLDTVRTIGMMQLLRGKLQTTCCQIWFAPVGPCISCSRCAWSALGRDVIWSECLKSCGRFCQWDDVRSLASHSGDKKHTRSPGWSGCRFCSAEFFEAGWWP